MRVNVNKCFEKKRYKSGFIMASGIMLTLVLAIIPLNIIQNYRFTNNQIQIKRILNAQNNLTIDNFSSIEYIDSSNNNDYDTKINHNYYKQCAKNGKIINGNLVCDNAKIALGPTYIKGNLEIKNLSSVELLGVVYVEGEILIKNFVKILGGYPLISEKNIEISNFSNIISPNNTLTPIISKAYNDEAIILTNGVKCLKTLIIAANGGVYIKNLSYLYGKAVGKDIKLLNLSRAKN